MSAGFVRLVVLMAVSGLLATGVYLAFSSRSLGSRVAVGVLTMVVSLSVYLFLFVGNVFLLNQQGYARLFFLVGISLMLLGVAVRIVGRNRLPQDILVTLGLQVTIYGVATFLFRATP